MKSYAKILVAVPLTLGAVGGLIWYGPRKDHDPHGDGAARGGARHAEHEPEGDEPEEFADHEGMDSTDGGHSGEFAKKVGAIPVAAILEAGAGVGRDSCSTAEVRGPGPEMQALSAADWAQVMDVYHDAKARLIGWLERQHSSLTPALYDHMKREIEMLRVQRPPAEREPDLAWRGIAVMTDDGSKAPLVRLGGGMIELVKTDRERATFEMARVLAQRWAPCALSQQGGGALWKSLEGCLQSEEDPKLSCIPGGYSESGWMISTAVAARVADPGCRISGLVPEPGRKECRDRGVARAPASHASKKAHAEPAHHDAEKKHDDSHSAEKAHAEPAHHDAEKKHDDSHSGRHSGSEGGH